MKPNPNPNDRVRRIGFYLIVLVLLLSMIYSFTGTKKDTVELEYSEVLTLFREEKVESFSLSLDGELNLKLKEPYKERSSFTTELASTNIFYNDLFDVLQDQLERGVLTEYDYEPAEEPSIWMSFLPYLIMMAIFIGLEFAMMNRAQGGAGGVARFSKARTRQQSDPKQKKTFADVAGADEEKAELVEIVDFLKDPSAYTEMGARIPKGVLLVGPPGTGKTLLAKAVAGEAGVAFLSISGSDFVELYVGVGAGRVRDLFEQAKKLAPAIVFIDEIDAVGRQRGSGLGGGHDEREQTLNQLLVEMDGFSNNEGVIVMAATNRADILDNALLRPGRFDRQIYVGKPDVKGREEILKVHAKGKPLADNVDLNSIARGTIGFTGADLENLLNEAALLAVRRKRRFVMQEDIDEAILKVEMGPEKKSHVVTEKERRLTAYHEAGHAVVSHYLKHTDPVHYITIIPRGGAGGFTLYRPTEDQSFQAKSEMLDYIVTCLGGRASEQLFLGDISTGASGDIQQATNMARQMVTVYGMSEKLGPISFDSSGHSIFIGRDFGQTKSYSEETAAIIDEEVKKIFDDAMAACRAILEEHKDVLVGVAEYLLAHETMEGDDFAYFCDHGCLPEKKPTVIAPAEPAPAEPAPAPAQEEIPAAEPEEEAPAGTEE